MGSSEIQVDALDRFEEALADAGYEVRRLRSWRSRRYLVAGPVTGPRIVVVRARPMLGSRIPRRLRLQVRSAMLLARWPRRFRARAVVAYHQPAGLFVGWDAHVRRPVLARGPSPARLEEALYEARWGRLV